MMNGREKSDPAIIAGKLGSRRTRPGNRRRSRGAKGADRGECGPAKHVPGAGLHIFIDFGPLCSWKPDTPVHANRPVVFMISASHFQPGQHT